jgi:ATP-dependent DNA helicase PIF1
MRVHLSGSEDGKLFSDYLLSVGNGTVEGGDMMRIPDEMQIKPETLEALIDFVFPDLEQNSSNSNWLGERAILCPTNEQAKEVNALVSGRFPGEEKIYKSSDTTDDNNIDFTPEFLNSCDLPGMALHCLKLKKGMLVMLLRNLDPGNGHCNGVKYFVNNLLERVIEVTAVNGSNPGSKLLVPRIIMINADATLPFSLRRKQYPLRPAFAMTANKSQGQTLARVGIYLGRDFFSHGQLYVALSRCGNKDEIRILTRVARKEGFQGTVMRKCVFREVLSRLSD